MQVDIYAFVFMAWALQVWQMKALSVPIQVGECNQGSCEEQTVHGSEESSLLQVNIGPHEGREATGLQQTMTKNIDIEKERQIRTLSKTQKDTFQNLVDSAETLEHKLNSEAHSWPEEPQDKHALTPATQENSLIPDATDSLAPSLDEEPKEKDATEPGSVEPQQNTEPDKASKKSLSTKDKANQAKTVNGVAKKVRSLIPTLKECVKTECDTAKLMDQVFVLASTAMVAAQFLVPAGPIIAMVGSLVAVFFQEDKKGTPPLTVSDVRGALSTELLNFQLEKLIWNMKAWSESLAGEVMAVSALVGNRSAVEDYKTFKKIDLGILTNSLGRIAMKLSSGVESLVDFHKKIKSTMHFSASCPKACRNERSAKWPADCTSAIDDVQSRMRTLYNGMKLFTYAASRLCTIKLHVDTIFEEQKWKHSYEWHRLNGELAPIIEKYNKIRKLKVSMGEHCAADKKGNEFLTQKCKVKDPPMLDMVRRVPFWNVINFGTMNEISANTKLSPDLTKETCNYEELMIASVWTCMGPDSTCSSGGPGWKKIGVTQGGGCKGPTCCKEELWQKLWWMKPDKGDIGECDNLCYGGGKDICVRPKVCAEPKCAEIMTDDKAWELTCSIEDCFW